MYYPEVVDHCTSLTNCEYYEIMSLVSLPRPLIVTFENLKCKWKCIVSLQERFVIRFDNFATSNSDNLVLSLIMHFKSSWMVCFREMYFPWSIHLMVRLFWALYQCIRRSEMLLIVLLSTVSKKRSTKREDLLYQEQNESCSSE